MTATRLPPEAIAAALADLSEHTDTSMWLTAAEGTGGGLLARKELITRVLEFAAPHLAATERAHEHEWKRCPNCPYPGKPCACSGVSCCEAERSETVAIAEAVYAERERIRQMAMREQAVCTGSEGTQCYFADLLGPEDGHG